MSSGVETTNMETQSKETAADENTSYYFFAYLISVSSKSIWQSEIFVYK